VPASRARTFPSSPHRKTRSPAAVGALGRKEAGGRYYRGGTGIATVARPVGRPVFDADLRERDHRVACFRDLQPLRHGVFILHPELAGRAEPEGSHQREVAVAQPRPQVEHAVGRDNAVVAGGAHRAVERDDPGAPVVAGQTFGPAPTEEGIRRGRQTGTRPFSFNLGDVDSVDLTAGFGVQPQAPIVVDQIEVVFRRDEGRAMDQVTIRQLARPQEGAVVAVSGQQHVEPGFLASMVCDMTQGRKDPPSCCGRNGRHGGIEGASKPLGPVRGLDDAVGRDRVVVRPVLPMAPGIHALGLSLCDLGPGPEGILAELHVDLCGEAAGDPLGQLSLSQWLLCVLRRPEDRSSTGTQDAHDLLDRQARQVAGGICSLFCGSSVEQGEHQVNGVVRKQQRIQRLPFHQDSRAIESVGVKRLRCAGNRQVRRKPAWLCGLLVHGLVSNQFDTTQARDAKTRGEDRPRQYRTPRVRRDTAHRLSPQERRVVRSL